MDNNFKAVLNENTIETTSSDKGRKLTAKHETFVIDEGEHKGRIIYAKWYKTAEEKEMVMLVFELEDGVVFKNFVDGEWIDSYPFSKLISQANISYVEDFIGLKVVFTVRNKDYNEVTFSNIKKIVLANE